MKKFFATLLSVFLLIGISLFPACFDSGSYEGYICNTTIHEFGNVDFAKNGKSITVRIIPKKTIYDVKTEIELYGEDSNLLEYRKYTFEKLKAGEQNLKTFTLSENAFTEGQTIKYCNITVLEYSVKIDD